MSDKSCPKTSIGGSALIEGVMMKGPARTAMAVRLPNGSIDVETWENKTTKPWYKKCPIIRGVFNFIDSMISSYQSLMKSAEKAGIEEEEPSAFEKKLDKLFGGKLMSVLTVLATVLGLGLALVLFFFLPALLSSLLSQWIPVVGMTVIEGVVKILIFILYLAAVSRMKDIHRVFSYHGAEHKTIACYEAGEELTVENVKTKTRFHPRCGTSFMFIVLIISIVVSSMVTWNSLWIRVALKILLLPLVMGLSYEVIRYAGRHTNLLTRIVSAPGIWMQRLTTAEPDDSMIEVAIESVIPVLPEEEAKPYLEKRAQEKALREQQEAEERARQEALDAAAASEAEATVISSADETVMPTEETQPDAPASSPEIEEKDA